MQEKVTQDIVGRFIDSKAGKIRQPKDVAGRLMEEVTELCLSAGLSAGEILGHVTDALHNQCLKKSTDHTVFPSQITDHPDSLPEEIADVGLVLKDLAYISNIDQLSEEALKWKKFTGKEFRVSSKGALYAAKPHIKEAGKQ